MLTHKQTARLARLREGRAKGHTCQRSITPFGTELSGRGEKGERCTGRVDTYGELVWNSEQDARGTNGYFADHWQDECVRFGVAKIRHAKGVDYVPVTWSDGYGGATYHFRCAEQVPKGSPEESHRECIQDVSVYADSCAELQAEEEREYAAKDSAEQEIEAAQEEIRVTRDGLRELLTELRKMHGADSPAICSAVTSTCRQMIADIREARERIAELQGDFWKAVPGY